MINISGKDVKKIRNLVELCPDTFKYIPLKFYKDEKGNSITSIETININGDIVFSGSVIMDNSFDLEEGTGMVIKLPLNKIILNNILKNETGNINITKEYIELTDKNKAISLALYKINEEDIFEFPYTGEEILDLVIKENGKGTVDSIKINLGLEEVQEFLSCVNVLTDPLSFNINVKKNNIEIKSSDAFGNKFKYVFNEVTNTNFSAKFDNNLIKLMSKIYKHYNTYTIDVIISELMIAFTLTNDSDSSIITLALTAQKS